MSDETDAMEDNAGYDPTEDDSGVICRYCDEDGLHWERVNGRPVLMEPGGRRHRC